MLTGGGVFIAISGAIGGVRPIGVTTRSGAGYGVRVGPLVGSRLSWSAVQKSSQSLNGWPELAQARCRTRLPASFKAESGVYFVPSMSVGGWPLSNS